MLEHIDSDRFRDARVGVIYGGRSAERPVSLETGRALAEALRSGGFEVTEYDFPDDRQRFVDEPPAAALLALHGGLGENGAVQGFLEMHGVPYTASGVLASALALDKGRSKALFRESGLMTPDYGELTPSEARGIEGQLEAWLKRRDLEPPVVVKPSHGGSSQGVSICESVASAEEAIEALAADLSQTVSTGILVEKYIDGPEYTVGIFDGESLGALEVIPGEEFYDYHAKYESGETQYQIVERPGMLKRLEAAGDLAYRCLGCRGIARADFVAGDERGDEVLYALEVNTIPGMTETSLVPKLAKHQGISFEEFAALMVGAASLDSTYEADDAK